jgi:hypothetical protein
MNTRVSIMTFCCAIFMAGNASAVSLTEPVGSFADFSITGTTVAARPELAGVVLEDMISTFSISGAGETFTGEIQNRVVRSVDGTLDFYWRIMPLSGTGDISAFRVDGFGGYTLDADFRIDGLGTVAPDVARYFGSVDGAVNFLFSNEVGIGQSSNFFFLDTQATNYALTGQFDLLCAVTGCISSLYPTFAPSAVPLPAAAWLFGSGLVGLIGISRRRNNRRDTK